MNVREFNTKFSGGIGVLPFKISPPVEWSFFFFLLICLMVLSARSAMADQMVTATGMSFYETGREAIAREKALSNAKRLALEKALGVTVKSESIVRDFQLVKDQVISRTAGYISSFEITKTKKSDLGTFEVTINAMVATDALLADLDRFKNMLDTQRNPRVAVHIEQGQPQNARAAAQKTVNLLSGKLKSAGFIVYRYTADKKDRLGLLVGVLVDAQSSQSNYQNLSIGLNEISLSSTIYRAGDEEILGTAGAVQRIPGENRMQILDRGARKCVDEVWETLRRELTRVWEKELYNGRRIFLTLNNITSHAQAMEIAAIFRDDVSGIDDASLVQFEKDTAQLAVQYRGRPEYLINEMQFSYFKNKYFKAVLNRIDGNHMHITIK